MNKPSAPADYSLLLKDAYGELEAMEARLDAISRAQREPIAIVGMACRFPGGSDDPEAFWRFLRSDVDAIRETPPDRWRLEEWYDPDPDAPGKLYSRHGAYLSELDRFDPQLFGIAPREAMSMSPQQRLLLEVTWEALEHAGQAPSKLFGSEVAVFIGLILDDYVHFSESGDLTGIDSLSLGGSGLAAAAGRLSYVLGVHGPNLQLNTACSSSLVTVHLACRALRARECDLALAGGANAMLTPHLSVGMSKLRALSPDGRARAFDASANGYVRGEGCGMVVLKRLSDALAAGDNVLALLRGSAINHDGRSNGLTAPNGTAQQRVIRRALADAGVQPRQVGYVETHGTGTELGDPIELEALGAVLAEGRSPSERFAIGSVKNNIGHLEAAAGVASLIKVVLALQHRQVPKLLHWETPNPHIDWAKIPVTVPVAWAPWEPIDGRRLAGVSSFGMSGTNAHIVLEEAPPPPPRQAGVERPLHLLCLSAKGEEALEEQMRRYERVLAAPPAPLADVCFTANAGRSHFAHRVSVAGGSAERMREELAALRAGEQREGAARGVVEGSGRPKVAFLFPGQGPQYVGMGRGLYQTQPTFRRAIDQCAELLRPHLHMPLQQVLYPPPGQSSPLDETVYTQPAMFALQYALAALWRSWGVEPSAVIGHSAGLVAAACVAGLYSLDDGLLLARERGRLQASAPAGQMAIVFADGERVGRVVARHADRVAVASINGPEETVISGTADGVERVLEAFAAEGVNTRRLTISIASHCPLMEPILEAFERVASSVRFAAPRVAVISDRTGRLAGGELRTAQYWSRHLREPVLFSAGIQALYDQGYRVFIEVGPSPALLNMGRQTVTDEAVAWLPSLRKNQDDWQQVLESLGALYARGVDVDWGGFDRDYPRRRVPLPTYPFQRERYWIRSMAPGAGWAPAVDPGSSAARHGLLGQRLRSPRSRDVQFETRISARAPAFVEEHRVYGATVFPGAAYLEMALSAAEEALGQGAWCLEDVSFREALVVPEGESRAVQVILTPSEPSGHGFEIFSLAIDATGKEIWTLHASGRIAAGLARGAPAEGALRLDEIRARCDEEIPVESFYERLRALGLEYGPIFRGLRVIRQRDGEALGLIELAGEASAEAGSYRVHPALLDACMQLTATVTLRGVGPSSEPQFLLPIGLRRLEIHAEPGARLWSHLVVRKGSGASSETLTVDLRLLDEGGRLVAEVEGLCGKRGSRHALQRADGNAGADWLYEIAWRPKLREVAPGPASGAVGAPPAGRWLIFADARGVGAELARRLTARGETPVTVLAGATYRAATDGQLTIDPSRPDDMRRLLTEARGADGAPYRGVVHLWGLDGAAPEATTAATLARDRALGPGSALHLLQALVEEDMPPPLWLVTRGAQAVEPGPVAATQAPLWGLGRVIALEHPEIWGGLIDLDPRGSPEDAALLLDELGAKDREDQVAFREGARYVARLVRHTAARPDARGALRSDATYLVTGGLSGLGLETARWMVEQGARHVVLVGRSGASEAAAAAVEEMNRAGAEVAVIQADVSCADDISRVLAHIDRAMPPLGGLIHSAGVLQDGVLLQQDAARLAQVMAPKVEGSWNLHALTQGRDLDFFVLYSSEASLLGSAGQGNYAAANAFADALVHQRRAMGLPALGINWGIWSEVGLAAALDSQGQRRLSMRGSGTISPRQGMQILGRLLQRPPTQVGVLPIDWAAFMEQFQPGGGPPFFTELARPAKPTRRAAGEPSRFLHDLEQAPPKKRPELLLAHVRDAVMRALGFPPSRPLKPDQGFFELGMDSVMAIDMKNRLQTSLGRPIPTTLIFEYPTVASLTRYLGERVLGLAGEAEPPPAPPRHDDRAPAAAASELDSVSSAELAALLQGELEAVQKWTEE